MTPLITDVDRRFPGWTDGKKYLIVDRSYKFADQFKDGACAIGIATDIQSWIRCFPYTVGTIYCATDLSMFKLWKQMFPELDLRHAYSEQRQ